MKIFKTIWNVLKAFVLPIVLWLVFVIVTGGKFAGTGTIYSLFRTSVMPILVAMGMAMGMTMGMMNFAAGAIVYAGAIIGNYISLQLGLGIPGMCVFAILVSIVLSTLMGLLYIWLKIPCLVLSLGYTMVVEALPMLIVPNGTTNIKLTQTYLANAPWCFVILAIAFAVFTYITSFTSFGANMIAIGSNIAIAKNSGINLDRVKLLSFVVSGFFLGLAAIILLSMNMTLTASLGFGTSALIFSGLMGIFIALVFTRFVPYSIAVLIGTFTIRILSAGMVSAGVGTNVNSILTGLFLFAVVTYSVNAGYLDKIKAMKLTKEKALKRQEERNRQNEGTVCQDIRN